MSPEPKEIRPGSERRLLFMQAGKLIQEAMENYQRLYPAEGIVDYQLVGFARESGNKELIHPLILCKINYGDRKDNIQLRALGGFPEIPCLANASVFTPCFASTEVKKKVGEELKIYWGSEVRWRSYERESRPLVREQDGNYFFLTGTSWSDYEESVGKDMQYIMGWSYNQGCQRLFEGIQNAMGRR